MPFPVNNSHRYYRAPRWVTETLIVEIDKETDVPGRFYRVSYCVDHDGNQFIEIREWYTRKDGSTNSTYSGLAFPSRNISSVIAALSIATKEVK